MNGDFGTSNCISFLNPLLKSFLFWVRDVIGSYFNNLDCKVSIQFKNLFLKKNNKIKNNPKRIQCHKTLFNIPIFFCIYYVLYLKWNFNCNFFFVFPHKGTSKLPWKWKPSLSNFSWHYTKELCFQQ